MIAIWIAILIILSLNVMLVYRSSNDLIEKAYSKGFTDGVHCLLHKEYVKLDQIIKND